MKRGGAAATAPHGRKDKSMKKWTIILYHRVGTEIQPEAHSFFNEEVARRIFTAMGISVETPNIDLFEEEEVNGRTVRSELIGRKDGYNVQRPDRSY